MYWNLTDTERLLAAFDLTNHDPDLLKKFLKDLLTEKEIETCEIRLKAMCLIHDGVSYSKIRSVTGLSPTTIARLVKNVDAKNGGFSTILKQLKARGKPYFD